jgi:transcriptional regulator with XRE-family HTH domain
MQKSIHTLHNGVLLEMLRSGRHLSRLRQCDLASRLGRGQTTVSNVERGERRLDVIELRDWLAALEVDFVDFMTRLDERLRRLPARDPRQRLRRATISPSGHGPGRKRSPLT